MKEFKNYVSYSGNKEQLERYAAELIKAGFKADSEYMFSRWHEGKTSIISYRKGIFAFFNHKGHDLNNRFRPNQFSEALKAATEPA